MKANAATLAIENYLVQLERRSGPGFQYDTANSGDAETEVRTSLSRRQPCGPPHGAMRKWHSSLVWVVVGFFFGQLMAFVLTPKSVRDEERKPQSR